MNDHNKLSVRYNHLDSITDILAVELHRRSASATAARNTNG